MQPITIQFAYVGDVWGTLCPDSQIVFNKMDSKIGFEISLNVVKAIRGRCEFHDSNGNGFGDIWWTDKLIYLSSTDGHHYHSNRA